MSIDKTTSKKSNITTITHSLPGGTSGENQNLTIRVAREHLSAQPQIPIPKGRQYSLSLKKTIDEPKPEPHHAFLEDCQEKTLNSILKDSYLIPGKNGTQDLMLDLFPFLRQLQDKLLKIEVPYHVSIALIGSAAGCILDSTQAGYNDLDFLIQIQIPVDVKLLSSTQYLDNFINNEVRDCCAHVRAAIEDCLATQLGLAEKQRTFGQLKKIGQDYFSNQVCINSPINWDDLSHPSDNRCSIIGFGELEFKTVIDICIGDDQGTIDTIPGLKNPSAFDRDDIRIYLTPEYLSAENDDSKIPLEVHSRDVSIKEAINGLTTKELRTSRICGSKCIKGMDNITFKGCFYPDEETNREIYLQFLDMPNSLETLKNHFNKHKEKYFYGTLCSLSNFCINGANLRIDPTRLERTSNIVDGLFFQVPGDLLLQWFQLSFFLSGEQAGHTPHLLTLSLGDQTYYLLKPKRPLELLQNFMQLLEKYKQISIGMLPPLGARFETLQQLFLQLKPHLKEEQLIAFNLCYLTYFPDGLDDIKNLEAEMLTTLLKALPKRFSAGQRQKLIQQTKLLLEKRNCDLTQFFNRLASYAGNGNLSISPLFLTCIRELALTSPKLALSLWQYADQEMIFAESAVDELEAFACIQKIELTAPQSKKQSITALENMVFRLGCIAEKLERENSTPQESFNTLLLSLISSLCKEDLDLKDLKCIQNLLRHIAPFPSDLKDKIGDNLLDALIRLASKKLDENELNVLLQIIQGILKTCSEEAAENPMNKVLRFFKVLPNLPTLPGDFIVNVGLPKIEIFKSIVIEEMQKGTLASSIAWFTLLNEQQLVQPGDQKSLKCCSTLLTRWKQESDINLFPQVLPALQLLKDFLLDTKLQTQALNYYSNFVESCLNSKNTEVKQAAESSLRSGTNSTCPFVRAKFASLFSDLICMHLKTGHAEILLSEALEKKTLSIDTPTALLKAYFSILEELIASKSDKLLKFIETALENPLFTHALQTSEAENINDRILLLLHNSYHVESPIASKNLVCLFEQLYKNISLTPSEKKNPELEILNLLLRILPKLRSVSLCEALVEKTHLFFEEKGINATELFKHLSSFALEQRNLPLSQIFLTCIQDLAIAAPKLAIGLWHCALEQSVFIDSSSDEIKAFAWIQDLQSTEELSKKQLMGLIKETIHLLSNFSKKMTSEHAAEMDPFHTRLLLLVCKLCEENFTLDDLAFIQKLINDIAPLRFVSPGLKDEIADNFLDALIRLPLKEQDSSVSGKKRQEVILGIFKEMLKICSEEVAQKIARSLKGLPNFKTIAGNFLKTPLFKSAFIKEMKLCTFEDNALSFTLLYDGKHLQSGDQKSLECCETLLSGWREKPSSKHFTQTLQALQIAKSFLDEKPAKQTNVELKERAMGCYVLFVEGCIHSKEPKLLLEADKALRAGPKYICPLKAASLFSDLICATSKPDDAEALLSQASKQKILGAETPAALIKAYSAVLEKQIAAGSKKIALFVNTALQNPSLITALLTPGSKNANELILLCMDNCSALKSPLALKNLVSLFKQLYKNRKTSEDISLDTNIFECTASMLSSLHKIPEVEYRLWLSLIDVLKTDEIIFKNCPQIAKNLLGRAYKKCIMQPINFITLNASNKNERETCTKLIKILERYEALPLLPEDFLYFERAYIECMLMLGSSKELLLKVEKIEEPERRFHALQLILIVSLNFKKDKRSHLTEWEINEILRMIDEFREPHPLAKDLELLILETQTLELLQDAKPSDEPVIFQALEILEELLKTHPEKFKNIEKTYTRIINATCKLKYFLIASFFLRYAEKGNIIKNQTQIATIQSQIKSGCLAIISEHLKIFNELKDKNPAQFSLHIQILLQNPNSIFALLHLPTDNTNELILLLIDNCNLVESVPACKNLVRLINHLFENRKISGDDLNDEIIRKSAFSLMNRFHEIKDLPNAIMRSLIDVIKTDEAIAYTFIERIFTELDKAASTDELYVINALNNLTLFLTFQHAQSQDVENLCIRILDAALNLQQFPSAASILAFAMKENIINDQALISNIKSRIKTRSFEIIDANFNLLKNVIEGKHPEIQISKQVTVILENPLLIELLLDPLAGNGNAMILSLIYNCQDVVSIPALENLVRLFEQLFKNREKSEDASDDSKIRDFAHALLSRLEKIQGLPLEIWTSLIKVLEADKIIFKDHFEDSQMLYNLCLLAANAGAPDFEIKDGKVKF